MRLPSILKELLQHPSPKAPPQEPTMAAAPTHEAKSMLAKVALECGGDISASQEEVLATASFLGGDNALPAASDEEEVLATKQHDEDEPVVVMCTLPFTPTPSKSDRSPQPPSHQPQSRSPAALSPDADEDAAPLANPRRKPRIRTPTPSPSRSLEQQQQPEQQPQAEQQAEQRQPAAVLMIPTKTTATNTTSSNQNPVEDFLALCQRKGLI